MPLRDSTRVALVAFGGAAGSYARWQVGAAPGRTLVTNMAGAWLLGYLVARVPVRTPRDEAVRLALGTGVLGGFTTFSAFSLHVAQGATVEAVAYAAGTVVAGVVAGIAGLAFGAMAGPGE